MKEPTKEEIMPHHPPPSLLACGAGAAVPVLSVVRGAGASTKLCEKTFSEKKKENKKKE